MKYTVNPKSGRLVHTKEHPELAGKKQFELPESRGVKWRDLAPMTRRARRELHAKCGDRCFLVAVRQARKPEGEFLLKYPICTGGDDCKLSCAGLKAALNATFRVANRAEALLGDKGAKKRSTKGSSEAKSEEHWRHQLETALRARRKAMRLLQQHCSVHSHEKATTKKASKKGV